MRKLFAGSLSRSIGTSIQGQGRNGSAAHGLPQRLPGTPLEQRVISALKEAGRFHLGSS